MDGASYIRTGQHSLLERSAKNSTNGFSLPLTDFGKNLTSTAAFAAHSGLVMLIKCPNFKLNRKKVSRATFYPFFFFDWASTLQRLSMVCSPDGCGIYQIDMRNITSGMVGYNWYAQTKPISLFRHFCLDAVKLTAVSLRFQHNSTVIH